MSSDDYELMQVLTADEWQVVQELRRAELFARHLSIVYHENHPDDRVRPLPVPVAVER